MTNRAVGYGAEAGLPEILLLPVFKLGGDLVPPDRLARTILDDPHVIQAERQEHSHLEPLVDLPLAIDLFGDTRLAGVQ